MGGCFQKQASVEIVGQQNQSEHYKKLGQILDVSLKFLVWLKFQETDFQLYFCASVLQEVLAQGFAFKSLLPVVCAVQLALSQWWNVTDLH